MVAGDPELALGAGVLFRLLLLQEVVTSPRTSALAFGQQVFIRLFPEFDGFVGYPVSFPSEEGHLEAED